MTSIRRFHVKNVVSMRRALEHHNSRCLVPATSFSLNPVDFGLLGFDFLWGVELIPDPAVAVKRFRLDCDGSAVGIEEILEEWSDIPADPSAPLDDPADN